MAAIFISPLLAAESNVTRLDKIVAIANQDVITSSQLTKEMDHAQKQLERTNQPILAPAELRKQALNNLILKSLQLQLCKTTNIQVSEGDVDKAIANIAESNKLSVDQLKEVIKQTWLSMKQYTKELQDQMLIQKLQQEQVSKDFTFTPEDVKKFIRENKNKFNQYGAYHVIDLLVPITEHSTQEQTKVKKQASQLAAQFKATHDIDTLLTQYPQTEKIDMGWRSFAEYPSLFQQSLSTMKLNDVSAPIAAPNGFHVLKLIETRGETAELSDKDMKNLAYQEKAQKFVKEWLLTLRQNP
jgi:peptidyl-prolyl cis-trans isomerase SurA